MVGQAVLGSMAAKTLHFAGQHPMLHGHLLWAGPVITTGSRGFVARQTKSNRFVQLPRGCFTTILRKIAVGVRVRMTQHAIDKLVRLAPSQCVDIPKGHRTATISLRACVRLGIVQIHKEFATSWLSILSKMGVPPRPLRRKNVGRHLGGLISGQAVLISLVAKTLLGARSLQEVSGLPQWAGHVNTTGRRACAKTAP